MNSRVADFAVFGSTPLAQLLAGLLASRHGKSVVLVGEPSARYRLPRAADISLGPITRPETWALLKSTTPDTTRLIGRIGGRHAQNHVDPIFFAESEAAREALGHVCNMARSFGVIVEPLPTRLMGADRLAVRVGDAVALNRPVLENALVPWHEQCGVERLPSTVYWAQDGAAARLTHGDTEIIAQQTILADDAAIEAALPVTSRSSVLVEHLHSTILTRSGQHLLGPAMLHLDSGTWLMGHEEGGMAAFGPGGIGHFARNLVTLLREPDPLQQAGQVSFSTFASADGAPIIGRMGRNGATILTGFGGWGTFAVPALARWFAGEASAAEADWFAAHAPERIRPVAEFSPLTDELPA
ncbi:hypothetical protein SAMN05216456_2245 [Devosia crocina]|uniref:Glycine/D-amino acid oxidase n=1 Tax=Devosia crocina TaxID=429728 RepID=A0A1I7NML2_9HYPH|nr:hypothetical protein [Devosia crocina]SFV35820.1 hypothetical protein SAMN05216456_2245 [Devosia crocina]